MKSSWPTKKLGEICEENISGDWGTEREKTGSVLCKVIRGTDFILAQKGKLSEFPDRYIDIEKFEKIKLKQGDILVEISGGSKDQPTGRILFWDRNETIPIAFSNFVKKILLNTEIVEPKFFFRYWQFLYFKGMTKNYEDRTTNIRNFKLKEFLENEEIPLPPLSIQQKIVRILDTIQSAIEIQEKIIEKTKELKRSLMAELFKYGAPSFRKGRKLKKTEMGEIPEDWKVVDFLSTLNKKAKFRVGELKEGNYQKVGKFSIVDQSEEKIAGYSDDEDLLYQGPLPVIIFGDHTRVIKFIDFPFIVGGSGVKILIPTIDFDINYFYYFLSALNIESRGYNRHFGILKEKLILKPPSIEQREIAEILQTIDQKIEIEKKKKELYEELFKTMLNKLMTGETKVNNISL